MRRVVCTLVLLALPGCVSSLREPGAIPSLPGQAGVPDSGIEAQAWFEQGTLESVRRAEEVWLSDVSESQRVPSLIGLTRARIWLATHESEPDARRDAAGSAVESGQWCSIASPAEVRCDYWLALALGVQARERRTTALDALPRIVELLESVVARQPDLDHAGAHRVLALVYLRAPGWPAGPGDPEKALVQARLAVDRYPEYPANQLCLAEALEAGGQGAAAAEEYGRAVGEAQKWLEKGHPEAREWLVEAKTGQARLSGG